MLAEQERVDITGTGTASYIAVAGSARNKTLAAKNTNVRPQEQTHDVMEVGDLPLMRACDGIDID